MSEILIPKKNVVLDATVLSTLMSCGTLADFRFNLNLQPLEGKSNNLEVGSLVHKVLEVFNLSIIKGVKRQDAIGYAFAAGEMYIHGCRYCTSFTPTTEQLKPSCGHQIDEYPGMVNTPQVPDKSDNREKYKTGWKWALETCEQYLDYYKNDSWVPLEVEVTKGMIVYEDDEIRILWKAKLDRTVDTNQGIFPVDVKTMKVRRDSVSLNNQFIGQCIVSKTRKMIVDKIGFQTTLEPKDKFTRTSMDYTADRLNEWQGTILPYWAKLMLMYDETGYWPPNFTHCENKYGLCQFKDTCESDRNIREETLKLNFMVGRKWDIGNEVIEE